MSTFPDTSPKRRQGGVGVASARDVALISTSSPPRWRFGLVLLLLAQPAFAAAQSAQLQTLESPAREASLISAKPDGALQFDYQDGAKTVVASDVISWGAPVEAEGSQVLLADGGVLVAGYAGLSEDRLAVDSNLFGGLELPLTQLAVVVLRSPTDPWRRDAMLRRLLELSRDTDRLVLENGDELTGLLVSGNGEKIQLESTLGVNAKQVIDVPVESVAAIVFNPALRANLRAATKGAWIGLSDGSLMQTETWTLDGVELALTRPGGRPWKSTVPQAVRFVQPLGGKVKYLSDLSPEPYRHVPYLTREWPYQLDRTVSGARLRAGGRPYVKGVGMHSASRLTFALNREYSRFEAELAIDDEALGQGSVVVRVFADAEERYRSPIVRGGDVPLPISVDVSGAQRLSLVVDHADRGDQLDRADWLNARLIK
ncbi:MAG: NPCBM/NEW2 domain-containing protein [Planctomycetia bacterium]|nr:NPCBM/NEW2 domain-containing protein [Planctomycetia bacterium]